MTVHQYTNKPKLFLWPTVSGGEITLQASETETGEKTTIGCCDIVLNYSGRSSYSPIEIRVMDVSGYTTSVLSYGSTDPWTHVTTSPTHSTKTEAIPVPEDGESVVGLDIRMSSGPAVLRRPQVVIIKHNPV